MTGHPDDQCMCGDARSSHQQNGTGACRICDYSGPTRCLKFRLWRAHEDKPTN